MSSQVFVQPVSIEVDLDRRLHRGDELIVEERQSIRDGELVISTGTQGAFIGRYDSSEAELWMHPLEVPGKPSQVKREQLCVKGVVIGMRSAL